AHSSLQHSRRCWPARSRIDGIGGDAIDAPRGERAHDLLPHVARHLGAHLLDRPAQAAAERDGPEIVRPGERLDAFLGYYLDFSDPAIGEKLADGLRCRDAVPRIERRVEIRAHAPHGVEPQLIGWCE